MKKLDTIMSNPYTTRIFCTDFGVMLDLCVAEKDNAIISNHAIVCIIVVLSNLSKVEHLTKNTGEWGEMTTNNCDKWIVFGDTLSKGKKLTSSTTPH